MPTLYILAGPNGVGKTTFANEYLPDEAKQLEFVNADLIARGLAPYDPESVSIEAGRITVKRIRELLSHRAGFTWETTMSGRTAITWIREARALGYFVKCYFLWVRDAQTTIQRIHQRVTEGGHNIDEAVSHRRFYKTIQNFFTIYRPLMDSWKLIDNSLRGPRLLAVEKGGKLAIRDQARLDQVKREANINI